MIRLEPLTRDSNKKIPRRKYIPWRQTQGAKAINSMEDADSEWAPCRFVIARSGDKCLVGSWIFARSPLDVSLTLPLNFQYDITLYNRPENWSLDVSFRYWRIPKTIELFLYSTPFKQSCLLDMTSLGCQCWPDVTTKHFILLSLQLYACLLISKVKMR